MQRKALLFGAVHSAAVLPANRFSCTSAERGVPAAGSSAAQGSPDQAQVC